MAKNPRDGLNVNENILKLADAIKADATVDPSGVISVSKEFYEKSLPEGIELSQVRKIQEHNSNLVSAGALALGELGVPHLKKHKDLEQVSLVINAGRDQLSEQMQRSKQVRNLQTGETKDVYGAISAKWRVTGTAGSRGSLKATRDHITNFAQRELA